MDAADYQVDAATRSRRQSEAIRSEIVRDARQAQREAQAQARLRAATEAAEARRPCPERLLQARCTACHPIENVLARRHTTMGWHGVIARMRWLNRASLAWDEHLVLAAELARRRPATGSAALIEHGAGAAALALPLWLGRGMIRRRRSAGGPTRPGCR